MIDTLEQSISTILAVLFLRISRCSKLDFGVFYIGFLLLFEL